MSRPEVTLENHEAVYEYYQDQTPNQLNARFLHTVFGGAYGIDTTYTEGAEQKIHDHFANDGRFIVAANHTSMSDPLVLASMVQREEVMKPLNGSAYIAAKAPLFNIKAIRPFLDNFVAVPVFRSKDVADLDIPKEQRKALRRQATERLTDLCADKADAKYNVAIFPQGERNNQIRTEKGVGEIAAKISDKERFLVMPIGIAYNYSKKWDRRPAVHVGVPFELDATADEVVERVDGRLKICYDAAKSLTR